MRMNTTLVINSKGGSGKTTLTTNLASYFAASNIPTALMDYDPQGSSINWLRLRGPFAPKIHGANAAPQKTGLRSIGMHVPENVRQLVIDRQGRIVKQYVGEPEWSELHSVLEKALGDPA